MENEAASGVGWGWKLACVLVSLAVLLVAALASLMARSPLAEALGASLGAAIIWPAIIVLLFGIGRRFRTSKARYRIWFVSCCVFLLGHFVSLLGALSSRLEH